MSKSPTKSTGIEPAQAKKVTIEWLIAEDDREWHSAKTDTLAMPTRSHNFGRRWWVTSAVALLFLLVTGGWLWHQAQVGLSQIEGELQAAVVASQWHSEGDSQIEAKLNRVTQANVKGEILPEGTQVELLELQQDWAIVRVTTMQGEVSYRQTLLYRRDMGGWHAVPPSAALWGAPRTLESTYFIFYYYALDTETIAEAAVKLDALYLDLAASYPLDPALDPASDDKRQIWVSPEYSLKGPINRRSDALEIASPAIYLAPTDLSAGDILAQSALLGLLDIFTEQSLARHLPNSPHDTQARARVYTLLGSLRLWQLWSTSLPLANLHKPTIQWVYSDVQGKRTSSTFDAQLCPLHQLWSAAPYVIQIPLFCGDVQQLQRYEVGRFLPFAPPRSLAEMNLFMVTAPDEPYSGLGEAEQVGLATLFDYAAATYGRQSLATLIANAASFSTWETLISATFGVSYTNFERGWQTYLHNYYGVATFGIP